MFASLNEKETRIFYIVLLSLTAAGLVLLAVIAFCSSSVGEFLFGLIPTCFIRETYGIYCPGCGGVRSLVFLLHGDILQSLWYHPFTFYAAVMTGIFLVHYTLSLLTKNRIKKPVIHTIWLYLAGGIIVVQWIVKLVLLLCFGIQMIPF